MTFRNTIAHANRLNGAYWQPLWAVTILLSVQTAIACPPARVVTRPDILVPTTDAVLEIIPAVHLLQRIRQETWLAHVGPEAYSLVQRLNPPQRQTVSPRGRSMATQTVTGEENLAHTLKRRTILGGGWIWKKHDPLYPSKYGIAPIPVVQTGFRG